MENLVEIKDAIVRRSGKSILEVDDFILKSGESIAILGPNGSGKSTFVGLITREVFPLHRDNPPVKFCGSPNMSLEELKMRIGFVSSTMQNQVNVHLPAINIVQGGLFGSLGVPKRFNVTNTDETKALNAMEELGISDIAHRDMMTLSTGQARRVLIARALIHNPQLLVFDEPTSGLDPAGMYYVRQNMEKLATDGRSIILVTHYPADIIDSMKRVVMIKNGKVFVDGPKNDLLKPSKLEELFEVPMAIEAR